MASNTATKIRVGMSGAQTISENTATKILFDVETIDSKGEFSTANSRFTASKTTRYILSITGGKTVTTVGYGNVLSIHKNGSAIDSLIYNTEELQITTDLTAAIILDLTASDYIELFFTSNTGTGDTDVTITMAISEISELVFEL